MAGTYPKTVGEGEKKKSPNQRKKKQKTQKQNPKTGLIMLLKDSAWGLFSDI